MNLEQVKERFPALLPEEPTPQFDEVLSRFLAEYYDKAPIKEGVTAAKLEYQLELLSLYFDPSYLALEEKLCLDVICNRFEKDRNIRLSHLIESGLDLPRMLTVYVDKRWLQLKHQLQYKHYLLGKLSDLSKPMRTVFREIVFYELAVENQLDITLADVKRIMKEEKMLPLYL